jgi:hypothetical protein
MTKTNSGTGPFALQSNPASVVIGTIDDNISDVRAAQIVAIFGTLWMVLVGLQMLNGPPLG